MKKEGTTNEWLFRAYSDTCRVKIAVGDYEVRPILFQDIKISNMVHVYNIQGGLVVVLKAGEDAYELPDGRYTFTGEAGW